MGDATRIFVPQMARVWLAPVGTASPDGPVVAMPAAWKEVGLFTPDSLSFATAPTFDVVQSHQSSFPTRRFQTTDEATMQVNLQEWSSANFLAVYGGGTFTTVTPTGTGAVPYYKFSPPSIGGRTQTACTIEIIDGIKHYRRVIPVCQQTEGVDTSYNKTNESTLPLRLAVIGSDVGDPWFELSDDNAMLPPV
jgi:hypothetical protein